ncbi:MAG TPA: hypothetical protein VM694_05315, partial [Polyangium sp.]|nr:hypothetical protein [Polyangium sp.]
MAMMNLLEDVLPLRTAMPFGPIALGAFSVAGISALALLVAALFAWRRGATRATRAFAALTLGTFALGAFAASRVLADAHRDAVRSDRAR